MGYSKTITYEIGANGDALTTTNTQSDTLRLSAGASEISTTQHHGGTRSLHMIGSSSSGLLCVEENLGNVMSWSENFWLYAPTLPSAETQIRYLAASGTVACTLSLNQLGILELRNAAGTNLYVSPAGKRITAGAWFHVYWDATSGTSGTQRLRLNNASDTQVDDSTTITSNNGTGYFTTHRRGAKAGTTTTTSELFFDDETMAGAYVPPTAGFVFSLTGYAASFDAASSSSVAPSTLSSYAWNFGDGNTGTGATTTHTYAALGSYIVTLTVTDSSGLTNTTTQTVTVSSLPVLNVYRSGSWVGSHLYVYSAGQWVLAE
jgi:hypothetical protein